MPRTVFDTAQTTTLLRVVSSSQPFQDFLRDIALGMRDFGAQQPFPLNAVLNRYVQFQFGMTDLIRRAYPHSSNI